ncbi:platelet binding protein GspB [Syngnathus scovelli]|uniref:platelet binding protein GspB n=1 Tax=Syngnathus scovelli TaxID=161590 RepID=UPI002110CFE8|nr:protein piccolo [Syngnathus scovelli]
MKPDGVPMDTTEPDGEATEAEQSSVSPDHEIEQAQNDGSPQEASKTNGEPDPQVKPEADASKKQAAAKTQHSPRSKSQSKHTNSTDKTTAKSCAAGAVPKKSVSVATVVPTVKTPNKGAQRRPMRNNSSAAATTTNGTRPVTLGGCRNRTTAAENVDAARAKSSVATSRSTASTSQRRYLYVAAKVDSGAIPKTSRPTSAPQSASAPGTGSSVATRTPTSAAAATSGSRSAPSTSRAGNNVSSRPPSTASSRAAASRATTLPSTGRITAMQPPSSAVTVRKDVHRPPSAAVAKRTAAPSAAAKKPEPSKPTAGGKQPSTSKWAAQSKTQQPGPAKPSSAASPKPPAASKAPLRRTPHSSPANKSTNGSTPTAKQENKPIQAVLPFSAGVKKTKVSKCNPSVGTRGGAVATVTRTTPVAEVPQETLTLGEVVPLQASTQDPPTEAVPQVSAQSHSAASSPPRSPLTTASSEISPPRQESENHAPSVQQEQASTSAELPSAKVASLPEIPSQSANVSSEQTVAKSITQVAPPSNLNDEEDEEEREPSQLVSVSEMSGISQPTEESRPGSAGPVGGSAWRAGGAFPAELDSLSGSQQGASELSAPGVLEGTESMDDLGEGSLKGAMDMEGASAGSPDFQKVPEIPFNDYEEEEDYDDDDDEDRVCDMDVGSEKTDELQRRRHDNAADDDEEDDDVEMASEAVTESGLESYGNADEDDFAEDERLDNLNRLVQLSPPPRLPSAPGAPWHRPDLFAQPWEDQAQPSQLEQLTELVSQLRLVEAPVSPLMDPLQADSETPSQSPAQARLEITSDPQNQEVSLSSKLEDGVKVRTEQCTAAPRPTPFPLTPEELGVVSPRIQEVPLTSPQPDAGVHMASGDQEVKAQSTSADELLRGVVNALASNPSSSSVTEDEASDTEGEALLEESLETAAESKANTTFEVQPSGQRCLSTVEEVEESETTALTDDATPPSATSLASYGFDSATTASNAHSAGEGCVKSPGIFSLEELPEESKELCQQARCDLAERQYVECRCTEEGQRSEAQDVSALQTTQEKPEDAKPPYYLTICEKTDNSFGGLTSQYQGYHQGDSHCAGPRLTCADLPPRKVGQQMLSPQLRRLEQHQKQLMEMQQRREQQSRPLEGVEQERKRTEEEEQKKKKDEAEEEIKRNEREQAEDDKMADQVGKMLSGEVNLVNGESKMSAEEEAQRHELQLQLLQQQSELKQRQQILEWQQELEEQQPPGRTVVLSPSSGLCTIYEALESSDEELDGVRRPDRKRTVPAELKGPIEDHSSPEHPAPLDLDWGAKVDMVQQLINQTLLLNRDGCSSLLLLPGGAGGTLSPLESSLWPSLLPPISPPSATVTSVSSFSPEPTGSSPQGEWTVVELETHH